MTGWAAANPMLAIGLAALGLLVLIAMRDVLQGKHAILHNFPIVGHFRYWLETIGPELRQYIVADDKEEMPFNRTERRWIYASAKKENNYFSFGTSEQLYEPGYPIIKNAGFPVAEGEGLYQMDTLSQVPCLKIIGESRNRKRSFRPPSVINISGMSFGSLGYRAIAALNQGAYAAGCYHNTGEGSVSPHHEHGADLVWQIGTGYFGARHLDGTFSIEKVAERIEKSPVVRAIEIKLSQGAKPGKGGVLPAAKVSREIATTRGIPRGVDCISPNTHSEFHNIDELIDFVELVAKESGLPVGIKAAVGKLGFWKELAQRMKKRKAGPDFIAIDGGEGGTGAAPLSYADHVSLPFKTAFTRVYKIFLENKLADKITWVGSGKLGFPDRAIVAFAMGCDLVTIAREAMMSIGCIQAQKCHTDHCPTGIATQNRWLQGGLHIENKARRFSNYVCTLRRELISLSHTAGYEHPSQFHGKDIEIGTGLNQYATLEENLGYSRVRVSNEEVRKLAHS